MLRDLHRILASWISPNTRMKEKEQKSGHQTIPLCLFPIEILMVRFTLPKVMQLPSLSEFKHCSPMDWFPFGNLIPSFESLCYVLFLSAHECRGTPCIAGI